MIYKNMKNIYSLTLLSFVSVSALHLSHVEKAEAISFTANLTGNAGNLSSSEIFGDFEITAYKNFTNFQNNSVGFLQQNINGLGVGNAPPSFFGNDNIEGRVGRRNQRTLTFFGRTIVLQTQAWEALGVELIPSLNNIEKVSIDSLTFGAFSVGSFDLYANEVFVDSFEISSLFANTLELSAFGITGTRFVIQPTNTSSSFRLQAIDYTKIPEPSVVIGLVALGGVLIGTRKVKRK